MPRTPNTECVLCAKPLYRRPNELARVRYAACMSCRGRAQSVVGVTEAQRAGLAQGTKKGTNFRTGYKHREESKRKTSAANKKFWAANPDKAKERGAKNRADKAYNWKGGSTRINTSIRQMSEYRRWVRAVCERDQRCVRCGSEYDLEAHHTRSFSKMLEDCDVRNREDARRHAVIIFDPNIGQTLCAKCHCDHHGRKYTAVGSGRRKQPPKIKKDTSGANNPNYRGGRVGLTCPHCRTVFYVKQAEVSKRKYCSRRCLGESQRKRI